MIDNLVKIFGLSLGVGLIALILLLSPIVFLWSINSLSAAGGSDFYIDHSLWNYILSIAFLLTVRGGGCSSK